MMPDNGRRMHTSPNNERRMHTFPNIDLGENTQKTIKMVVASNEDGEN